MTAKKEGLRLLGSLPLDPEVVRRGDAGDLAGLDDDRIPFVHEFNKIVEQVEGITNREQISSLPEVLEQRPRICSIKTVSR